MSSLQFNLSYVVYFALAPPSLLYSCLLSDGLSLSDSFLPNLFLWITSRTSSIYTAFSQKMQFFPVYIVLRESWNNITDCWKIINSSFVSKVTCRYRTEKRGWQSGAGVSTECTVVFLLVRLTAPSCKLIQSADTEPSWTSASIRCQTLEGDSRPDDKFQVQLCLLHTPHGCSCVKEVFTSSSGYTGGCALVVWAKLKRCTEILSFDPCVKKGPFTRLFLFSSWSSSPLLKGRGSVFIVLTK